jgi:hypothetical protein
MGRLPSRTARLAVAAKLTPPTTAPQSFHRGSRPYGVAQCCARSHRSTVTPRGRLAASPNPRRRCYHNAALENVGQSSLSFRKPDEPLSKTKGDEVPTPATKS